MIPSTTSELPEWLEQIYPTRCVLETETEIEAHRYAAKCELIDFIKIKLQEAKDDGIASLMESK